MTDVAAEAQQAGTLVTLAVLLAAVLHATWNALAHGVADRVIGFSLIGLTYTAVGGVVVMFTGPPALEAWPLVLASAAVHVLYQFGLLASYRLGEFSQVYPLARGTSPWVVTLLSAVLLGQHIPPVQLAGVLVVSAGLLSLVFVGGLPGRVAVPGLLAAFGTGLLIATYTVIDGVGVYRTGVLGYAAWMFLLQGPALPLAGWASRRRSFLPGLRRHWRGGIAGGLVSMAAYGIVLWAQTRATLGPVAALRETSIVFGALLGVIFLGERMGRGRAVLAGIVVAGIVLIDLA